MALLTRGSKITQRNPLLQACRHLAKTDQVLGGFISRIGPCGLRPRRQYFLVLCDSIISQQLSLSAASTIFDRYVALYPHQIPTPEAVLRTRPSILRAVGLSRRKVEYLHALAAAFDDGSIVMRTLVRKPNEAIIAHLTAIRGIGQWTAEMFLIFALHRLDVLPASDLGIQKAIQQGYRLSALPAPCTLEQFGRHWHPYESVACWYLWHSLALPEQDIQQRSLSCQQ